MMAVVRGTTTLSMYGGPHDGQTFTMGVEVDPDSGEIWFPVAQIRTAEPTDLSSLRSPGKEASSSSVRYSVYRVALVRCPDGTSVYRLVHESIRSRG